MLFISGGRLENEVRGALDDNKSNEVRQDTQRNNFPIILVNILRLNVF